MTRDDVMIPNDTWFVRTRGLCGHVVCVRWDVRPRMPGRERWECLAKNDENVWPKMLRLKFVKRSAKNVCQNPAEKAKIRPRGRWECWGWNLPKSAPRKCTVGYAFTSSKSAEKSVFWWEFHTKFVSKQGLTVSFTKIRQKSGFWPVDSTSSM